MSPGPKAQKRIPTPSTPRSTARIKASDGRGPKMCVALPASVMSVGSHALAAAQSGHCIEIMLSLGSVIQIKSETLPRAKYPGMVRASIPSKLKPAINLHVTKAPNHHADDFVWSGN
ncbi:hypothetical protein B0H14DRAFT_3506930 [Mycena olivaceomarginata]|nr:hypothetical protein B0H14DRAFT_3506930 [Mycena olivaceomarginata]